MNMKTTIITMLLLAAGICAVAQEKWEYAIILLNTPTNTLHVSINGETYTEEKFEKKDFKSTADRSPVLRKVNELMEKGWEVFQYGDYGGTVYMRKKKQ